MSRFYGSLNGTRGEATKTGSANSGMSGHVRGWNIGAQVVMSDQDGKDTVALYITGGSQRRFSDVFIGTWQLVDGKPVKVS